MRLVEPVAIAGSALCLPLERDSAEQALARGSVTPAVVRAEGIQALRVCAPDETSSELAARTITSALARAKVDPSSVDLLAYGWLFERDERLAPNRLAQLVGVRSGAAFGVRQMSNGGAAALELVARSLVTDPAVRTAVAVTSDSFRELPYDRWLSTPPLGDGAASVVLTRGSGPCVLRAITSVGDPGLELRYPGRDPFAPLSPEDGTTTAWGDASVTRGIRQCVADVVTRVLSQANLAPDDSRIALVRSSRVGRTTVRHLLTAALPRPLRSKVVVPGEETGHLGAGDLLANLAEFELPRPGQFHLLISVGAGLTATAAVVEGKVEPAN
ncbi:ketoacyl-ACP synthase III family protein [Actinoallomurus spadix]|uniref:3-oxoacyl-ACP synthase n=1 Tax=Actinoallomurus spadix TaxID=79912 RepID=A0ABN0XFI4_9ACTN|nr:ketoacyl-ACP synthase III family protein [Actinoallomurus spadix]MCO5988871.1 ketoacyl-ACP synthase III family protein [Actinoallomurus spadix]